MKQKRFEGWDDKAFDIINTILCILVFLIVLYPLIFIVSASFSDPLAIVTGRVVLFPVDFNIESYISVFRHPLVGIGYRNTLILMVVGTSINVFLTVITAYPLSRNELYGRNAIMLFFTFTMFMSGGLIPTFIVVRNLGLFNTMWAMILPSAISMFNVIVTRTFFKSNIPDSLVESAYIDGASNTLILVKIVLPMSKAVVAVIVLFYGVAHWNQFFLALIYIRDRELWTLQLVLREILLLAQIMDMAEEGIGFDRQVLQAEGIRYALIIVASLPVLVIYPFIQKYFVKGVMIGAIKG